MKITMTLDVFEDMMIQAGSGYNVDQIELFSDIPLNITNVEGRDWVTFESPTHLIAVVATYLDVCERSMS